MFDIGNRKLILSIIIQVCTLYLTSALSLRLMVTFLWLVKKLQLIELNSQNLRRQSSMPHLLALSIKVLIVGKLG